MLTNDDYQVSLVVIILQGDAAATFSLFFSGWGGGGLTRVVSWQLAERMKAVHKGADEKSHTTEGLFPHIAQ